MQMCVVMVVVTAMVVIIVAVVVVAVAMVIAVVPVAGEVLVDDLAAEQQQACVVGQQEIIAFATTDDVAAVAAFLCTTKKAVYSMVARGQLPQPIRVQIILRIKMSHRIEGKSDGVIPVGGISKAIYHCVEPAGQALDIVNPGLGLPTMSR